MLKYNYSRVENNSSLLRDGSFKMVNHLSSSSRYMPTPYEAIWNVIKDQFRDLKLNLSGFNVKNRLRQLPFEFIKYLPKWVYKGRD